MPGFQKSGKFMCMKKVNKNKRVLNIHKRYFWDINVLKQDWDKGYLFVIGRIIERGGQEEVDELIRFYGRDKVMKALRDEISFLPNYGIDNAIGFFPELKKEEMFCYLNRKDKPYHWI